MLHKNNSDVMRVSVLNYIYQEPSNENQNTNKSVTHNTIQQFLSYISTILYLNADLYTKQNHQFKYSYFTLL